MRKNEISKVRGIYLCIVVIEHTIMLLVGLFRRGRQTMVLVGLFTPIDGRKACDI
jgi:hypothetical protein